MGKELESQEWYQALIEECKAIITEAVFTSRWALVEGYWNLGKRIREDVNFQEYAKGNKTSVQQVAQNIGTSERTLYYALQAFDQYPDIDKLPEGKNITWKKLITKYLPAPKEKPLPLPPDKFPVIYADPPWKYGDELIEGYGAAEHHYPAMSIKELCELPVKDLAPENGVLFLWVTSPLLDEWLPIVEAWGFEYKASFIWDKVEHNYAHYNSMRHEILLICTRGSCLPESKKLIDSVVSIKRSEVHSQKPEKFREIIDTLYPSGKAIELFFRGDLKKLPERWEVWGMETQS